MLVTWMLCLNLLFILIYWRRLGWSRSERLDTALLLVLFCTRKAAGAGKASWRRPTRAAA